MDPVCEAQHLFMIIIVSFASFDNIFTAHINMTWANFYNLQNELLHHGVDFKLPPLASMGCVGQSVVQLVRLYACLWESTDQKV